MQFNGAVGNIDSDINDSGEVRIISGDTVTIEFDTSVNEMGYDISGISTIFGWTPTTYTESQTNNQSRSNQGYEISVSFVDGSVGILAGPEHWEPNGEEIWTESVGTGVNDQYWTKVSFTNEDDAMVYAVESITFEITNPAWAGGILIAREFDIFGTVSDGPVADEPELIVDTSLDSMSWDTIWPFTYSVQQTTSLTVPDWSVVTNVTGTPPETSITLPTKTEDQLFYRVIVE